MIKKLLKLERMSSDCPLFRVPLDKMAALDLPAPPEPEDSLVSWDSQDPREPL